MNVSRITLLAFVATLVPAAAWATPTTAAELGTSITISDANFQNLSSSATATQIFSKWYANHEDNETETNPNTVVGQQWDLEGMYLNGNSLTLVGGFDFRNGANVPSVDPNRYYKSGDIFIDVTGDAKFGFANNHGSGLGGTTANTFGYDYVIHFDTSLTQYSVMAIDGTSIVARATDVSSTNPWKWVSGGQEILSNQSLQYGLLGSTVVSNLTSFGSPTTGLQGHGGNNNHYYLTVDLGFLPTTTLATLHYTMECGNDNLMGQTAIVSVPDLSATASLLLLGLAPLVALRRRRSAL